REAQGTPLRAERVACAFNGDVLGAFRAGDAHNPSRKQAVVDNPLPARPPEVVNAAVVGADELAVPHLAEFSVDTGVDPARQESAVGNAKSLGPKERDIRALRARRTRVALKFQTLQTKRGGGMEVRIEGVDLAHLQVLALELDDGPESGAGADCEQLADPNR